MSDGSFPIIRKPRRSFPLPVNKNELNVPWPDPAITRHARVDIDREGYESEDNPLIVKPGGYDSDLLSKI